MTPEEYAEQIKIECEQLESTRGTWERLWEQVARRIFISYAGKFSSRNTYVDTMGAENSQEMIDSTGARALIRFAAAMESMLTPRNSRWHHLAPSDKMLKKNRAVRAWFEDLTEVLFDYRYAPRANYASQKHEEYMGLGAFGTSSMFIDRLRHKYERGIRYRAMHLGQIFFKENHQGLIDTAFRKFPLTARNAVQQFAGQTLPKKILEDAVSAQRSEHYHWFIHKVSPREEGEYDPNRLDLRGMLFKSCYVSLTECNLVTENGYNTFPYTISRYVQAPNELYGRSPAIFALPSLRLLNEQKKTVIKQGQRIVDPVLLAHDDGVADSVSLRGGAIIPGGMSADGKPLVGVLPTGNIAVGEKMMEIEQQAINDFFLVSLFQILVETPQMTATEVIERAREKGALLSPTMGRQQSESLGPQIEREIDVLMQQGLVPPMPEMLREARGEYQVVYDSPLSRTAKAEEVTGLMRTVDYLKEVISVTRDPEPLDFINWDEAVPGILENQSVPLKWQATPQQVAAKRQGRAQAAQQQAMIDAGPSVASTVKSVSGMVPGGR